MNVLQINSVCGVGSTGRIVTDIADTLRKNGHDSYVAYGYGKSNEPNSYKMESELYLKYNILKTRFFGKHGFYNRYATKQLVNWIETISPDIIHLHNIHGHYLNVKLLFNYLKEIKKPIVWTLHDCWSFTRHCTYFDYVGCERWKNECYSCPQKRQYPVSWFFDRSQESFREKKKLFTSIDNMTLITPSEWLSNLVKQSFLKEYPVRVINNGIDLNVFKPCDSNFRNKHNLENKFIVLGVASGWSKRKGLTFFHQLSEHLSENYQIIVVGVTGKQKQEMPRNIIGITRTNNVQELAEIYSAADVFINPTLEDNFPTTNLEALACGTPVITFNTGGSVESVDEKTGIVVKQGNIEQLVNAIKTILKNGKETYHTKCILKAAKCYDKQAKYLEYIKLYQSY
jgi:putative colanic acid biosynthesis glycosyltransferase